LTTETAVDPPGSAAPAAADGPRAAYALRRAERQHAADLLDRRLDRLGLARVIVFASGLVLGFVVFWFGTPSPWWLAAPALTFFGLLFAYDRVRRRLLRAQRAVRFYARGLERLDGQWAGRGEQGARYLDEAHLYAQDLDLFGRGSLFERLCSVRTRLGEDTLAAWLKSPAPVGEVKARQEAVAEMTPRLDLREDLAMLGAEVPPVDFAPLVAWSQAPAAFPNPLPIRLLALGLGALNTVTLLVGIFTPIGYSPFLVSLIVSAVSTRRLHGRVREVLAAVEKRFWELVLLAELLGRMERESFAAPRLRELRAALDVEGHPPSEQLARLVMLVDWLNARKNQFFAPIAYLLLWGTHMALSLERWRGRSGPAVARWLEAVSQMEALGTLAGYAYECPDHAFPEVVAGPPCLVGAGLGHPLLAADHCVRNDVDLGDPVRLLVISGSNMSGKSTMLRAVGVNAVLALAGAPVRAARLRLTPLALGATLRVQDSLLEGRSRFFAEITRVRAIMEKTKGDLPVLFLLDELFHGTNSHDRGVGAEAVLRHLLDAGAVGAITTHDLALAALTQQLAPRAANVHFADQLVNGEIHFDYRMRPGVVPHSNALALMRAIGLDV
jgi:hypothetical protein